MRKILDGKIMSNIRFRDIKKFFKSMCQFLSHRSHIGLHIEMSHNKKKKLLFCIMSQRFVEEAFRHVFHLLPLAQQA